jgi:MFS family permease
MGSAFSLLVLVCVLTFLHFVGAQMRGPILPLYAAAHGATATGVGLIVGAHMAGAAVGSIPLGRAADVWGPRRFLLGGMAVGVVTSLLLPVVDGELALMVIYGLAGVGVAAYTPSALTLVAAATTPARAGRAFAWYSTAHYGAIGVGPFLGGLAAEHWGYRAAFVASAAGVALALAVGLALPLPPHVRPRAPREATFAHVTRDARIWAGWIASVSGMLLQGVVFTFLPLLAHERGLAPARIGVIFLALGVANTLIRAPAGQILDRTGRSTPYAVIGVLVASATAMLVPRAHSFATLVGLAAVFGAVSGVAFVAISVALAGSATADTRGVVMGGYSTSLYLGLALGSFALGPVITHAGYGVGFAVAGGAGVVGILVALWLWSADAQRAEPPTVHVRDAGTAR